jgi:hypothetical protein
MSSNKTIGGERVEPRLKTGELLLRISKIEHNPSSIKVSALYTKKNKPDRDPSRE